MWYKINFGEQLEMKTDFDDKNYTYEKLQNIWNDFRVIWEKSWTWVVFI